MSKKKKKRVDLDIRPYPNPLFRNYDYTSEGPNETSPGGSPYHGEPAGGEKSMGKWIKKRRKALEKRKKKLLAIVRMSELKKLAMVRHFNSMYDAAEFIGGNQQVDPMDYESVTKAYKRRVQELHPDRNPNIDPDEITTLNLAYELWKNQFEKGEDYDLPDDEWYMSEEERRVANMSPEEYAEHERQEWMRYYVATHPGTSEQEALTAYHKMEEDISNFADESDVIMEKLPTMTEQEAINVVLTTRNPYLQTVKLLDKVSPKTIIMTMKPILATLKEIAKTQNLYNNEDYSHNLGVFDRLWEYVVSLGSDAKLTNSDYQLIKQELGQHYFDKLREQEFVRQEDVREGFYENGGSNWEDFVKEKNRESEEYRKRWA